MGCTPGVNAKVDYQEDVKKKRPFAESLDGLLAYANRLFVYASKKDDFRHEVQFEISEDKSSEAR